MFITPLSRQYPIFLRVGINFLCKLFHNLEFEQQAPTLNARIAIFVANFQLVLEFYKGAKFRLSVLHDELVILKSHVRMEPGH